MRDDSWLKLALLMLAIGAICGGWCIGCAERAYHNKQAIQHGAAHYDAVSGEFKWNDEKGDE